MIKCICINDKNKPNEIPAHKWVKEGEEYTIIFAIVVLPQRKIGFQLEEIMLDESCHPYEYFLAERFALRQEDIERLIQFIYECTQINISVKELMKETHVTERTADTIEAD